jgi:hypothetical protein
VIRSQLPVFRVMLRRRKCCSGKNPFEFERWAVGLIRGRPNDKQVGDKGSDGELIFPKWRKSATTRHYFCQRRQDD